MVLSNYEEALDDFKRCRQTGENLRKIVLYNSTSKCENEQRIYTII